MQIMRRGSRPDHASKVLVQLGLASLLMIYLVIWKSPNLPKAIFYSLFREVSKGYMALKTIYWPRLEGEHFIVKYRPGDEEAARLVLGSSEKFFRPVVEELKFEPMGKTTVLVYPTREALGRSFGWAADESAMGVYFAGVIRVLSPGEWITAASAEEQKAVFINSGPMAHEFAHLLVDYRTGGNYTRWFTEGLALYTEYKLTGFRFQSPFKGELYPLKDMDGNFDNLPDQNLAYCQSFAVIQYIVENYGEDRLDTIMVSLRQGKTIETAFGESLGISFEDFEQAFKNWAKQRGTL